MNENPEYLIIIVPNGYFWN